MPQKPVLSGKWCVHGVHVFSKIMFTFVATITFVIMLRFSFLKFELLRLFCAVFYVGLNDPLLFARAGLCYFSMIISLQSYVRFVTW